ncbi:MAG: DUF3048 domain-containing protein [Actinobacteria bacterium]|nr:DUF3048 domain-containing protein [Actinomycetota bacterium]
MRRTNQSAPRTIRRLWIAGAMVVAAALAACGGDADAPENIPEPSYGDIALPSTLPGPTTTLPTPEVMPLTGLAIKDAAAATRPALAAKIDNHPTARPQAGLNQADIVYEENVEQLTRYAAVFHTNAPTNIGPIRSGRTQDVDLLSAYLNPLFVWSGGNGKTTSLIRKSVLVDMGALVAYQQGGYKRDPKRKAPHNLYADASKIYALTPKGATRPPQQFLYRSASDAMPATATASAGLRLSMAGVQVQWLWNSATGDYLRSMGNDKHMDADGSQVNAKNVVVLYTSYKASAADPRSPEAQSVGEGEVWVYTNGSLVKGKWKRAKATDVFSLTDLAGAPVKLSPGRTWIELPRANKGADVPAGTDPTKVKFP